MPLARGGREFLLHSVGVRPQRTDTSKPAKATRSVDAVRRWGAGSSRRPPGDASLPALLAHAAAAAAVGGGPRQLRTWTAQCMRGTANASLRARRLRGSPVLLLLDLAGCLPSRLYSSMGHVVPIWLIFCTFFVCPFLKRGPKPTLFYCFWCFLYIPING